LSVCASEWARSSISACLRVAVLGRLCFCVFLCLCLCAGAFVCVGDCMREWLSAHASMSACACRASCEHPTHFLLLLVSGSYFLCFDVISTHWHHAMCRVWRSRFHIRSVHPHYLKAEGNGLGPGMKTDLHTQVLGYVGGNSRKREAPVPNQ
jgi:hypothetical protein